MTERPYEKWLTILTRLEGEITKSFPPKVENEKEVEDPISVVFRRDFSAMRGTLRNLQKMEKT